MSKSIVITSGKGGVGKSTTAASIGCGLAGAGYKTVILDMDIGLRSLDMLLGIENSLIYDIVDVIEGVVSLDEALYKVDRRENLYLLPACQTTDSSAVSPYDVAAVISSLRNRFDYILIDCPAGIGRGFRNATGEVDKAIVVLTPDAVSLRGAERVKNLLALDGVTDIAIVINRVSREKGVSTDECVNRMDCEVLGFVPEDPRVAKHAANGIPLIESETDSGDAYERIVRRLLGETVRYKIPFDTLIHKFKTHFGKESACKG
ncbi:MAG: septum site-determining protein MinD [Clostridia bacterium]|nr:septum site-determining protein MinD [Clostridia bacterium]MBQ2432834.1 septum site-determining protein MinD [Clostridia bacterium]